MESKKCSKCLKVKPLSDFYKHKDGYYRGICKLCANIDSKIYRNSHPEKIKFINDNYRKTILSKERQSYYNACYYLNPVNKIKTLARYEARKKILLDFKDKCEKCGSADNLQRHHPDYSKPLEVIILCKQCHYKINTFHEILPCKNISIS